MAVFIPEFSPAHHLIQPQLLGFWVLLFCYHNFYVFSVSLNTKFLPPNYFMFPLYARDHLLLLGWPHTPKMWWTQLHSPCLANGTFSMTSSDRSHHIPGFLGSLVLIYYLLVLIYYLLGSCYLHYMPCLLFFLGGSLFAKHCILDITDNKSRHN